MRRHLQPFFIMILIAFLGCISYGQGGRSDPLFSSVLATDANVTAIETQAKILVAGKFTTVGAVSRKDILRLNIDGSVDAAFNAGTGSDNIGMILAMKLQADGKVVIAGSFNTINGTAHNAVARLNTDGSVDMGFAVSGLDITFAFDVDIQPDGKVLLSASNLIGLSFIARLNTNGSNDGGTGQPFFSISGSYGYKVLFIPTENRILVSARGGASSSNRVDLVKLFVTGGQDPSFSASVTGSASDIQVFARSFVRGKILIWGKFSAVDAVPRQNVAIVNSVGAVDVSFVPATTRDETILAAAVQTDEKVLIGGYNFPVNSFLSGNLVRLNTDGSADSTFRAARGVNKSVKCMKISNGGLVIGGDFFRFQAAPRAGIARAFL